MRLRDTGATELNLDPAVPPVGTVTVKPSAEHIREAKKVAGSSDHHKYLDCVQDEHAYYLGELFELEFHRYMGALVKRVRGNPDYDFWHIYWEQKIECKNEAYAKETHSETWWLNVMDRPDGLGLQDCDIYVFARTNQHTNLLHMCGWCSKERLIQYSVYVPKGESPPDTPWFTASQNMYCIQWKDLHRMEGLRKC